MRERGRRDAGHRLLGSAGRDPGDRAARRRERRGRAARCGLDGDERPPRGLRRLADWSVARCAGKVHVPTAGPGATARRSRERRGSRRRGHLGCDRGYRVAAGRTPGRGDALRQEHRRDALPPRHPVATRLAFVHDRRAPAPDLDAPRGLRHGGHGVHRRLRGAHPPIRPAQRADHAAGPDTDRRALERRRDEPHSPGRRDAEHDLAGPRRPGRQIDPGGASPRG